ncbi:Nif3-like dinuclear metal center hexameric protein [Halobacillus seohaensis]|uniref:GTP cyclohydrolase 1 type 2 homolog n=1 Tax=Halobacillus seohaensis TaxID=447421 RepID=A0ABW2EEE1_9BACI
MGKDVKVADLVNQLERIAPTHYAFDWDNVGLQVGSYNQSVKRVMISLDVLENVVDEAISQDVDLIIAHHPLLFVKLSQIDMDTAKGRTIQKLIQHNISVYAAHTNLDVARGGVNDVMTELLGIEETAPLVETEKENFIKLALYVPNSHSDLVRNAISEAGAGHIGDYSHCTYQVEGEGTFKPQEGTNPFIGNEGNLEKVEEKRIETILPKEKLSKVLNAMTEAHPYEEAAYDLYPLLNEGESMGIGRIGRLKNQIRLGELCELVKEKFAVPQLRYVGDDQKYVQSVALLGGSGEKYMSDALSKEADVYITGDTTFHLAQEAMENGLAIIDPGHHVEKVVCPAIKNLLEESFASDVKFIISASNTEPYRFK